MEPIRQKTKSLTNRASDSAVKGFRDFTGEEAEMFSEIKKIIVSNFERYGFQPAETPVIEQEDFVKGGDKNENKDEVISDIFKLKDKGKRNLALRYEFTFQLKRLMSGKKMPYKRYEIGNVFRDEPVSSNRLRQFTQCDADIVGVSEIPSRDEAEILSLTEGILRELGIKPIILINNRKLLNEIFDDLKIKKNKEQILREIDKSDKVSEKELRANLGKLKAEKVMEALKQGEDYFNKFESYKEIISLMDYCRIYGINVRFSPTIVRGLSYYNGAVFEIKAEGIKETIVGGGSYNFNGMRCTGISFGVERLMAVAKLKLQKEKYLVVSLGQDKDAIKIVQRLRYGGKEVSIFYGKPTKALEYANSYRINNVIFVGEKEVRSGKFKVKDMRSGKESALKF
ncbi:MAG: ATP phosphoribosyltransferase regulatory subunit [Candidatus Pacearchaeota archaeon]|nr:ATP phosphoribosyltransferase regulatory subunit [Candidatus Pacearchaeota archaeon]MDE1848883.1 ATP phosphoribosyltransferase regulatory subunit [Nanoarchaeota archaeon]